MVCSKFIKTWSTILDITDDILLPLGCFIPKTVCVQFAVVKNVIGAEQKCAGCFLLPRPQRFIEVADSPMCFTCNFIEYQNMTAENLIYKLLDQ